MKQTPGGAAELSFDRFIRDLASNDIAFEHFRVEVQFTQRVSGRIVTPLRCGSEEDAEESKDANGGDDEDKKATIGDARLGSHSGIEWGGMRAVQPRSVQDVGTVRPS